MIKPKIRAVRKIPLKPDSEEKMSSSDYSSTLKEKKCSLISFKFQVIEFSDINTISFCSANIWVCIFKALNKI